MTRLFGLCLFLLGATMLAGIAGPILINATTQGQQLRIDASIKDGDLVQALTTLFNKVGFQVQIGQNVTGTIPNLQFTREPFEGALKKILAAAGGDLQFEKLDEDSYRIRSGDGGALPAPPLKAPDDAAVTAPVDDIKIIKVVLPKMKKINDDGTVADTTTTAATTTPPATGATEEEEAAETEECFIGMFTVYNLQLEGLCMMFGDDVAQFVPTQMINYGNMMNNNNNGNGNGYGFNNSGWGNNNSSWGNNNNGWGNNNNNWNSGYNNNNYNNNYNNGYNNYNNGYNNYNNNYNNNNGYYR